jgi:hypothetical protein
MQGIDSANRLGEGRAKLGVPRLTKFRFPILVRHRLEPLPLAPKTRGHLRELLHRLMDDAM